MYEMLLWVHSWWRWAVLLALLVASGVGWVGWLRALPAGRGSRLSARFSALAVDVQIVLGLLLYFVASPFTHAAFADMGGAMKNAQLRFWLVEHGPTMLVAVVLVHVGNVRARRAASPVVGHRRLAVYTTVATLLVLAAVPWPGRRAGRPLFRPSPGPGAPTVASIARASYQ